MRELTDSTPLVGDAAALRAEVAVTGALLLRGLVDPAKVTGLGAEVLRAVGPHGWLAPGSDPLEARPAPTPLVEAGDGWWPGYRAIQSLESLHRLAHDDAILAMLRTLFGEEPLAHRRNIARVVHPQAEGALTPPHQDFSNIGGTVDTFTLWMPLGDTPVEKGGLRVLPGSHLDGMRTTTLDLTRTGAGGIYVDSLEPEAAWATADYAAGDAVLFHSLTVHAAVPNRTDRLRLSVDFRYQPASLPVSFASLAPHLYETPGVLVDWSELTTGWSTTRWVDPPTRADVTFELPLLATGRIGTSTGDGRSRFFDSRVFEQQVRDQPELRTFRGV